MTADWKSAIQQTGSLRYKKRDAHWLPSLVFRAYSFEFPFNMPRLCLLAVQYGSRFLCNASIRNNPVKSLGCAGREVDNLPLTANDGGRALDRLPRRIS